MIKIFALAHVILDHGLISELEVYDFFANLLPYSEKSIVLHEDNFTEISMILVLRQDVIEENLADIQPPVLPGTLPNHSFFIKVHSSSIKSSVVLFGRRSDVEHILSSKDRSYPLIVF